MKTLISLFIILSFNISLSQVGIGTTTPNASAMLDIESINSGILIPRMTQAQRLAITTPAIGLMVYQTNSSNGFWFYDGTTWNQLTFGATGEFQSIGGVVQNTTNVGSDDFVFGSTTLAGSGERFFFDKSKGAFRAGSTFGNEWNDVNVGDFSIALGTGNTASGDYAVVIGQQSNATALGAFAAGSFASASGENSVSLSRGTASGIDSFAWNGVASGERSLALSEGSANGERSVAIGQNAITDASATGAVAFGEQTQANASYSHAYGYGNTSSGDYSVVIGQQSNATALGAFAAGSFASASGENSVSLSRGTASGIDSFAWDAVSFGVRSMAFAEGTANGNSSVAIGGGTIANSYKEWAIGSFNETNVATSTTTWNANDWLFSLGNGVNNGSRSNAITVLKDGKIGFSRIPTTNTLEVNGAASKNTAGDWLANSDRRLKKNINTFNENEALNKLLQMRGVTYEWNDNKTGNNRPEGQQYGFIAQELLEVFPENVELDSQGYYQTGYGTYDALYVQSIKALNSKIKSLEKENMEYKAKIDELYSMVKSLITEK
jgi:trimeric autotransporter adhesin